MSRLTAAQVISIGEYLNDDFDPSTLTVSQLLGVLGFHNIRYPSPYTKPKLVQLFNAEVKARRAILKKARLKRENSLASDDGVVDGLTGMPVGEGTRKVAAPRRSSRKMSKASEDETSPVRPDPPKRRRSSAQPNLGGPSRKAAPIHSPLVEESEPEEEELRLPARKAVRRKKTSQAAGAQSRGVSPPNEDSGWDDNNIFQSGAESSSPIRPRSVRAKPAPTRKSIVAPRKSRKSASAPPELDAVPPPPPVPSVPHYALPQSGFKPQLPLDVFEGTRALNRALKEQTPPVARKLDFGRSAAAVLKDELGSVDELNLVDGEKGSHNEVLRLSQVPEGTELIDDTTEKKAEETEGLETEELDDEEQQSLTPRRQGILIRRPHDSLSSESKRISPLMRLLLILLAIVSSGVVLNYKAESSAIGFCESGTNTNNALEALKGRRNAEEACVRENRTLLYLPPLSKKLDGEDGEELLEMDETPCPIPPIVPLPHPLACTPCPEHGDCTQFDMTCENGYILRSHPVFFWLPPPSHSGYTGPLSPSDVIWRAVSFVANGLPGCGSVAFPSRCVEDSTRKRNIGALGKAIEAILGQERGKRLCNGDVDPNVGEAQGGAAKQWGLELEGLRESIREKTPPHLLNSFDDTFNEAIQQLTQWGGVIIGENAEGQRYVAHKTADLNWSCAVTVKSREAWQEWRKTVIGIAVAIGSLVLAQRRRAVRQAENKRVAELVQVALDMLRNQELAHHTDPITAPQPFLSSLQLRDLVLENEHSVSTRTRLWDQVERVVEGNANVRANLEEVQGGDELRVWRWVGSTGKPKRVQFEDKGKEEE